MSISRMRKWRLQLMPLHNLDNEDSDEEELLNDDQAPTFQVCCDQSKINSLPDYCPLISRYLKRLDNPF